MKVFLFLWLALAACGSFRAEALELDGQFSKLDKNSLSPEWMLHPWHAFKPLAQLSYIPDESVQGANNLNLSHVRGKNGALVCTGKFFPCRKGDTVRLTAAIRGQGVAVLCLYFYNKNKQWNGSSSIANIPLGPDWKAYTVSFPVSDGFAGASTFFRICIGCGPESQIRVRYISAEFLPGKKKVPGSGSKINKPVPKKK